MRVSVKLKVWNGERYKTRSTFQLKCRDEKISTLEHRNVLDHVEDALLERYPHLTLDYFGFVFNHFDSWKDQGMTVWQAYSSFVNHIRVGNKRHGIYSKLNLKYVRV